MNCIHLFPIYPEIFPVFSYDKTSQHSKWMVNLNIDWSRGWILSCFFGCERKIHKPKPWIYPETFHLFSYDKTPQYSKWMDNLKVDGSSGWILSYFVGREGKIHKPKPWINQGCKEIHTATLGMKLTSVVCKLEIKINLSKSKVKLHPYSKSISTTKCVILPLFEINMHHQMWNRAPTPNRYAPLARTGTRGLQHVNWVCRPLHHQSSTLSS